MTFSQQLFYSMKAFFQPYPKSDLIKWGSDSLLHEVTRKLRDITPSDTTAVISSADSVLDRLSAYLRKEEGSPRGQMIRVSHIENEEKEWDAKEY
jgi:hypothetical protein